MPIRPSFKILIPIIIFCYLVIFQASMCFGMFWHGSHLEILNIEYGFWNILICFGMFWHSFPSLGMAAKSNDNTTTTESWKHFVKSFRITNSQITNKFSCNIKFISHYNLYLEILMVGNTRVCIYRYISDRNPSPLKYHYIFINNSINSCLLVYNILMFSMYLSYKKISFTSKIFCKFSLQKGGEFCG